MDGGMEIHAGGLVGLGLAHGVWGEGGVEEWGCGTEEAHEGAETGAVAKLGCGLCVAVMGGDAALVAGAVFADDTDFVAAFAAIRAEYAVG